MSTAQSQTPQTAHQQGQSTQIVREEFLSITEVRRRINQIGELLRDVLQEDVHYGKVPGCGDKPTLLKPGADKICMMFRLEASYEFTPHNLPNGHREYDCTCTLTHIPTGTKWGQGVGFASTMESKHRYRGTQGEPTGNPVPRAYWDARNAGDMKKAQDIIGGTQFMAKKNPDTNGWEIFKKLAEKQENLDPADQINTVKKMAAKRARVDAVLTATAASDCFTQDIGDDVFDEDAAPPVKTVDARPVTQQAPTQAKQQPSPPANDASKTFEAFKPFDVTDADLEAYIGAPANQWSDDEFKSLRAVFSEIRSGAKKPGEFFPRLKDAQASEITSLRDRIWAVAKGGAVPEAEIVKTLKAHGIMDGMEAVDGVDNVPVLTATAEAMEKLATAKGGN